MRTYPSAIRPEATPLPYVTGMGGRGVRHRPSHRSPSDRDRPGHHHQVERPGSRTGDRLMSASTSPRSIRSPGPTKWCRPATSFVTMSCGDRCPYDLQTSDRLPAEPLAEVHDLRHPVDKLVMAPLPTGRRRFRTNEPVSRVIAMLARRYTSGHGKASERDWKFDPVCG